VLPADPAEGAVGAERGVDQVGVVLVRRTAGDVGDERGEDRDQDQEDDEDPPGEGDLVLAQPAPGDLAQRATLDLLAALGDQRLGEVLGRVRRVKSAQVDRLPGSQVRCSHDRLGLAI
jgi:hypothetical protein